jgi:outer membrane protein OmpA-like peptidoglycan-associated protein
VEANYSPTFADVMTVSGGNWTTSAFSAVVGFRYGLGNRVERRVAPPPARRPDTTQVAVRPDTTVKAGALTAEGLSDTLTIQPRLVHATEVHALLPYVFFDQDSAVIPARYVQLDRRSRSSFQVERIAHGNTLNVYYELLNIIGQRMRDNRRATLTLTGCVGQFEHQDTTLARRRAEAVRNYLVSVWRLQTGRITIVPRLLPSNASLSEVDTVEGSRENQRVEIASNEYAVVAPVMLPDTSILAPVGTIRFLPPASTPANTDSWSLDVMIGDSLVRDAVTGTGPVPQQIDFPIENRPDLDLRNPVEVSSTLVIRDTAYEDLARLASQPVLVRQQGRFREERPVVDGHYLDRYNLLLFSFDSAGVFDFSQQATSIMQSRIASNSTVRVIGHTDRIGLPSYNLKLSQRRAEVAASLLGVTAQQVIGMGEKNLLYDNRYPEGRYYCRTVTVEIETPTAMAAAPERVKTPLNARRGAAERDE